MASSEWVSTLRSDRKPDRIPVKTPHRRLRHANTSASPAALSLSLLNTTIDESHDQDPNSLRSSCVRMACRELENELNAVEKRLSFFRDVREHQRARHQLEEELDQQQQQRQEPHWLSSNDSSDGDGDDDVGASSRLPKVAHGILKNQDAGQVADEVEHALLNCERLLTKAANNSSSFVSMQSKSQAALGQSHASHRIYAGTNQDEAQEATTKQVMPPEETALETKAFQLKQLMQTCQLEMEQQAAMLCSQQATHQSESLKDLRKKFESKKRVLLVSLRETCQQETEKELAKAQLQLETQHKDELNQLKRQLLSERDQLLHQLTVDHQKQTETATQQLEMSLEKDTKLRKQMLLESMEREHRASLEAIQCKFHEEFEAWKANQQEQMHHKLEQEREAKALQLLQQQEAETQRLAQEMEKQQQQMEQEQLEKLRQALLIGSTSQLSQLRERLEKEQQEKIQEMETNAALVLERDLKDMQHAMEAGHEEDRKRVEKQLESKHRIAMAELKDRLDQQQQHSIQELEARFHGKSEELVALFTSQATKQQQTKLDALRKSLECQLAAQIHELQVQKDRETDLALQQLRQNLLTKHQEQLEAQVATAHQLHQSILTQARDLLVLAKVQASNQQHDDEEQTSSDDDALDQRREHHHEHGAHEVRDQLKHLMGRQDTVAVVPMQLVQQVNALVAEFDAMADEQTLLLAKIHETTQLFLHFKRRHLASEQLQQAQANDTARLQQQLTKKQTLCDKLFAANQVLLDKFQSLQQQQELHHTLFGGGSDNHLASSSSLSSTCSPT